MLHAPMLRFGVIHPCERDDRPTLGVRTPVELVLGVLQVVRPDAHVEDGRRRIVLALVLDLVEVERAVLPAFGNWRFGRSGAVPELPATRETIDPRRPSLVGPALVTTRIHEIIVTDVQVHLGPLVRHARQHVTDLTEIAIPEARAVVIACEPEVVPR